MAARTTALLPPGTDPVNVYATGGLDRTIIDLGEAAGYVWNSDVSAWLLPEEQNTIAPLIAQNLKIKEDNAALKASLEKQQQTGRASLKQAIRERAPKEPAE